MSVHVCAQCGEPADAEQVESANVSVDHYSLKRLWHVYRGGVLEEAFHNVETGRVEVYRTGPDPESLPELVDEFPWGTGDHE